jgi:hypothetical protein
VAPSNFLASVFVFMPPITHYALFGAHVSNDFGCVAFARAERAKQHGVIMRSHEIKDVRWLGRASAIPFS